MADTPRREMRLYAQISAQLRDALAQGKYAVGDRLPSERDLAVQFGVSRPTIREALIALEVDGMVEVRTNSGVYVLAHSPSGGKPATADVGPFELLEARRLIEAQVAGLAARLIRPEGIARLRDLVEAMATSDVLAAEAADREFHVEIARSTGNSALETTVATLWDSRSTSQQYRLLTDKVRAAGVAPRDAEHRRIVDALAASDAAEATSAMWDHLTRVIDALLDATEVEVVERARADIVARRRRLSAS